jgi:hypothetical protein
MVAFILCLVMPEDLLYEVYYFKYQNYILYILLAVILHLFLTCMLMFYGLKTVILKNQSNFGKKIFSS